MNGITLNLRKVSYNDLNSRQKENYNYAHVAAVLADYGFTAMRLTDDWQGADFIAQHIDGEQFIKVQLKSRLWVNTKYKGKNIWICFRALSSGAWYLYPHDQFLYWCMANLGIGTTAGWANVEDPESVSGAYSWPGIPQDAKVWLAAYAL
jgi:hypothetical protein